MKKVILLICVLGLACVVARAQANGRDAYYMGEAMKGLFVPAKPAKHKEKHPITQALEESNKKAIEIQNKDTAQKEAEEANEHLRRIIQNNKNFEANLNKIIESHNELIEALKTYPLDDKAGYQELAKLNRTLVKRVAVLNFPKLVQMVAKTLDHKYYSFDSKGSSLRTLEEIFPLKSIAALKVDISSLRDSSGFGSEDMLGSSRSLEGCPINLSSDSCVD